MEDCTHLWFFIIFLTLIIIGFSIFIGLYFGKPELFRKKPNLIHHPMNHTMQPTQVAQPVVQPAVQPAVQQMLRIHKTSEPHVPIQKHAQVEEYIGKYTMVYSLKDNNMIIPDFSGASMKFVTEDIQQLIPEYKNYNPLFSKNLILPLDTSLDTLTKIFNLITIDYDEGTNNDIILIVSDVKFKTGPKKLILAYNSNNFNNYKELSNSDLKNLENTLINNRYEMWVPFYSKFKFEPK